ncbi:hypothetical protein MHUMG1_08348 [Metarhizium humberi]|uniref:Uncharacterized protein n=1 Tax=Metarhizium humberi TaxID=2596975 RepID=A0A9P8M8I2_9HYPO|nr:hypothetical protein MHUMG1_08348 [Metarhizium humberi]
MAVSGGLEPCRFAQQPNWLREIQKNDHGAIRSIHFSQVPVANLGPAISICHSHQDEPNSTDAHAHRGRGQAAFLRPRPEEARLAHNGNGIHVIGRGCWVEHDKTAGNCLGWHMMTTHGG